MRHTKLSLDFKLHFDFVFCTFFPLLGQSTGGPVTVPGTETTLVIRGLKPKNRYFFRVKCENSLGESQFGAEVAVTTLDERRYRLFVW